MSLYSGLLLFSVFVPFIMSFDRKVGFYQYWRSFFPSALIVASIYIIVDIFFVKYGIWGFNPEYHSSAIYFGLPLEEWLFFIVIPYACVFIHYVFVAYFPSVMLSDRITMIITVLIIFAMVLIVFIYKERAYTVFNFSILIIALVIAIFKRTRLLNRYYLSFIIMLIPFLFVNGILTGTFIRGEVVWYNNSETLGIRLLTIPVEDIGYAFSLVLLNLLLTAWLENRFHRRKSVVE
jgi:lycopene cyclase domain-containing protein